MSSVFALIFVVAIVSPICFAENWNYDEASDHGPDHWDELHPQCGDGSQSPVDIPAASARYDAKYRDVEFINYDKTPAQPFTLTNNGHTVQLTTNTGTFRVKDGGLPDEYVLEQLHFHWGADDSIGSEHEVDGRHYALEVHFVHRKSKFASVNDALVDPDGVAVLGVFGEVTTNEREADETLKHIVEQLDKINENGHSISIEAFPLRGLLPHSDRYYRYHGSLTTPPCAESVIWTLFAEPIKITSAMLEEFRKLHETVDENLEHNYRPTQPLNGRAVYTNVH